MCSGSGCSSVKKTTNSSSSGVVGAKSANCAIKNTATENAMSKSTQSIFEKALASNDGKGLSLNEMSQSLKNSGVSASSSLEQGSNADHSFSNKQYIDITDSDGKTYRLWDRNKDGNISADDFNNQLSGTSSLLSNICSGSNCPSNSCLGNTKCSGSGDSGSDCSGSGSSTGCGSDGTSCNNTTGSNSTSTDDSDTNGSGLLGDVKAMLIARNPDLANNNTSTGNSTDSTDSILDTLANQKISEAKSALGPSATTADILKYIADDLNGKHTTVANATNTSNTTDSSVS